MDMHDQALQKIGRRRDSRLRLRIPAKIETTFGTLPVTLLDLSQSGAHVFSTEPLATTGDAVLTWLHYEAFGRIVWFCGPQAGLEFDKLLAPSTLLTTRDIGEQTIAREERRETFEAARAWYNGYR